MTTQEKELNTDVFETELRPSFEGCNVGTWIGFKHVMYLAEEAVVQWFREQSLYPSDLLENKALSLELTDCSLRLIAGTRVDDTVIASIKPIIKKGSNEIRLKVELFTVNQSERVKVATGKTTVQFARAMEFPQTNESVPRSIAPYVVDRIHRQKPIKISLNDQADESQIRRILTEDNSNSFIWKWRIPYFYCHNTYRLQMSGYVRVMEEVVDQFLYDRGISIGSLLYNKDYNWIPVVSASKISILEEAQLEDELYTVFTVEDIMQEKFYKARMDCYVQRDGELVQTATGSISHAYVAIADRRVGTQIATFDKRVQNALTGATA